MFGQVDLYDSSAICSDGKVMGDKVTSWALRAFVRSNAESLDDSNRMAAPNVTGGNGL